MFDLERLQKQSGIIGTSLGIRQVLEMIMQISPVDISVLVTGESGTGKEVVAKAIHKFSKRKNEEFRMNIMYHTPVYVDHLYL